MTTIRHTTHAISYTLVWLLAALLAGSALAAPRKGGNGKPGGSGGDPAIACVSWHAKHGVLEEALMVMDADGSNQALIYKEKAPRGLIGYALGRPTWSPDGTQIAFARFYDGGIFTIGVDGSGLARLTPSPSGQNLYDRQPAWSPDGTEVAYSSWDGDIHIIDADGTNDRHLTTTALPARELSPTWAPDGNQIAYRKAAGDVYVHDLATDAVINVTSGSVLSGSEAPPRWARTHDTLAVTLWTDPPGTSDIYLIDLSDPNNPSNVSNSSLTSEVYPAWSPDDTQLVFQRGSGGTDKLYVASVDGSGETLLAEYPPPKRWLWAGLRTPAWRR